MNSGSKGDQLEDFLFSEAPLKQAAKPAKQENPPKFVNINSQGHKQNINHLRTSLPAGVNPSNKTQDDLQELIEEIPYPTEDLSLTSFTNSSNTATPNKQNSGLTGQKKRYVEQSNKLSDGYSNEKSDNKNERVYSVTTGTKYGLLGNVSISGGEGHQQRLGKIPANYDSNSRFSSGDYRSFVSQTNNYDASGVNRPQAELDGSQNYYTESMTPARMNKIMDWSKNHVTPGDSKNIFPQVIAPSIEFSHENMALASLSRGPEQEHKPFFGMGHSQRTQDEEEPYEKEKSSYNKSPFTEKSRIDRGFEPDRELLEELGGEKLMLDEKNVIIRQEISKLRIENSTIQQEKGELEGQLEIHKKIQKKTEEENNYLAERINEMEEQVELLQEKYKDKASIENLRGKALEASKQQIKQLKLGLKDKDDKINALHNKLTKLQNQEEAFQESVEAELTHLQSELEKHRLLSANYRKNCRDLEEEIKRLHEHIEAEANESENTKEIFKQEFDSWQSEMNRVKKENDHLHAELGELKRMSQAQLDAIQSLEEERTNHFKEMQIMKERLDLFMTDGTKVAEDRVWQTKQAQWEQEMNRMRLMHERDIERLKMQYSENSAVNKGKVPGGEGSNPDLLARVQVGLEEVLSILGWEGKVEGDKIDEQLFNCIETIKDLIEKLGKSYYETENTLNEVKQKLQKISGENSSLQRERNSLREQLVNHNSLKEEQQKMLEETNSRNEELFRELEGRVKEINQIKAAIEEESEEKKKMAEDLRSLEEELEQLHNERGETQSRMDRMSDEIQILKRSERALKEELNSVKQKNMPLSREPRANQGFELKISELEQEIDRKNKEIFRLEKEKKSASETNETFGGGAPSHVVKFINGADLELERRADELQKKVNILEQDNDELKELLVSKEGNSSKEIEQLKHSLQRISIRAEKLQKENDEVRQESERSYQALRDKSAELKHVIESYRIQEENREKVSNNSKNNENQETVKAISELRNQIRALEKQHEAEVVKSSEWNERMTELHQILEAKEELIQNLKEQINASTKEKDKKNIELYNKNKSLAEQLKNLEDALRASQQESEKKNKSNIQKQNEIKTLLTTNKQVSEKNQELMSKLQEALTRNENFERKSQENSAKKSESSHNAISFEKYHRLQTLCSEFQKHEGEFSRVKSSLLATVFKQKEDLKAMSGKLRATDAKWFSIQSEYELLQSQNKILKEKLQTLETTIKELSDLTDSVDGAPKPIEDYEGFRSPTAGPPSLSNTARVGGSSTTSRTLIAKEREKFIRASGTVDFIEKSLEENPFGQSLSTNFLENFSPEMLSAKETVTLMNEILRRALGSKEMKRLLAQSEELQGLLKMLFGNSRDTGSTINEDEYSNDGAQEENYTKRENYANSRRGYQTSSVKGKYFESDTKGRAVVGRNTTSMKQKAAPGVLYNGFE